MILSPCDIARALLPSAIFAMSAIAGPVLWTLGLAGTWPDLELAGGLLMMLALFIVVRHGGA